MKGITAAVQKGGVGKTALSTMLCHYLHLKRGLRVLVIDLDHQGNMTGALKRGGIALPCPTPASELLTKHVQTLPNDGLVVVGADGDVLLDLESQSANHNDYATNFRRSIRSLSGQFDVCIIDLNPAPDIRQLSALIASTHVFCPVQLSQESIEGVGHALNSKKNGIFTIRDKFNPAMDIIGLVVNLVEPTPFQRQNLKTLITEMEQIIFRVGDGYAAIKKSTAVFEAQSSGMPIWLIKKESARNAWRNIEPVLAALATRMQLPELATEV